MWYIVISQFLPSIQSPVPSPQTVHYAVSPRCGVVGNHQLKMFFSPDISPDNLVSRMGWLSSQLARVAEICNEVGSGARFFIS